MTDCSQALLLLTSFDSCGIIYPVKVLHNGWGWGLEVVWITSTSCPAWNLPVWYNRAVGKYLSEPLCQGKFGQVGPVLLGIMD